MCLHKILNRKSPPQKSEIIHSEKGFFFLFKIYSFGPKTDRSARKQTPKQTINHHITLITGRITPRKHLFTKKMLSLNLGFEDWENF